VGVEVTPEVFALTGDGHANEHVIITGSPDPRPAGLALSRASGGASRWLPKTGRKLNDKEAEALNEATEATGATEATEATGQDGPYTRIAPRVSVSPVGFLWEPPPVTQTCGNSVGTPQAWS
jgi:hypothetical protein